MHTHTLSLSHTHTHTNPFPRTDSVHGDKPWQRRWVTFNGTELKYFKNQSDKDKSSRNIITLAEMIDVKKVPDVSVKKNVEFCRSISVQTRCLSSSWSIRVACMLLVQSILELHFCSCVLYYVTVFVCDKFLLCIWSIRDRITSLLRGKCL